MVLKGNGLDHPFLKNRDKRCLFVCKSLVCPFFFADFSIMASISVLVKLDHFDFLFVDQP